MAEEKNYTGEWQMVDASGADFQLFRQKVPGGWLTVSSSQGQISSSYVPDEGHLWDPPIKQGRKKGAGFY